MGRYYKLRDDYPEVTNIWMEFEGRKTYWARWMLFIGDKKPHLLKDKDEELLQEVLNSGGNIGHYGYLSFENMGIDTAGFHPEDFEEVIIS